MLVKIIVSAVLLFPQFISCFLLPLLGWETERRNNVAPESFTYEAIPDNYIVLFKEDYASVLDLECDEINGEIKKKFPDSELKGTFKIGPKATGFFGKFEKALVEELASKNYVKSIEEDQKITMSYSVHLDIEIPDDVKERDVNLKLKFKKMKKKQSKERKEVDEEVGEKDYLVYQDGAPWGLSRISSRQIPTDYQRYYYPFTSGTGVTAYVIDSGIMVEHSQFQGRAKWGASFVPSEGYVDANGHGTHVSGTIGGYTYGVAKKVNLVAVKVFDKSGSGSTSGVISAINWVVNDHNSRGGNGNALSVINMSLGGGQSSALDSSVAAAVSSGVHVVVAAGNSNDDACKYSPSGAPSAISVAATDSADNKASFSNWGGCVFIHAPGVRVLSSYIGSTTATAILSGTSMATPHTTGVVALVLALRNFNPTDMKGYLVRAATQGIVKGNVAGTVNRLLNINRLWGQSYLDDGELPPIHSEDPQGTEQVEEKKSTLFF